MSFNWKRLRRIYVFSVRIALHSTAVEITSNDTKDSASDYEIGMTVWGKHFIRQSLTYTKGPVTLLRIVLAYASVWKISLIRRYTLTYVRGTVGIRCIRFKHGRIRWHTLAYAGIRRGRKFFLSMFKNFVRIGRMLYTISIL
jgi:hypothetical protein